MFTNERETCGRNIKPHPDHNDIKWFRKREALQAKKAETFKTSKTESSSALRLKDNLLKGVIAYFLGFQIEQFKRGISIKKERYVMDLLEKYDKIGSSVNTPIVPPNMLGPDLNGKAINETQYRGMIGSLMCLTVSIPNIQVSLISVKDIKQILRNPTLLLLRELSVLSVLVFTMFSAEAEDVAAVGCCANILWIKSQLTDYDIINEKLLDKPSFKRLIDELGMLNIDSKPEALVLTEEN
ncbi:hypothetical protein Tco_1087417 [Tanacetum coccineum]